MESREHCVVIFQDQPIIDTPYIYTFFPGEELQNEAVSRYLQCLDSAPQASQESELLRLAGDFGTLSDVLGSPRVRYYDGVDFAVIYQPENGLPGLAFEMVEDKPHFRIFWDPANPKEDHHALVAPASNVVALGYTMRAPEKGLIFRTEAVYYRRHATQENN